jgi:isopentenyldiphosphate isomerase
MSEELFDIVDEQGNVIGTAPRSKCHGDPSLIHRTAHVFVFHPDGNSILLQLRRKDKDIQPGKWDTSVGGHLDHGEDYETAAYRELREELGFTGSAELKILFDAEIRNEIESENTRVYSLTTEGPFSFQKSEIDDIRFWSFEEIDRELESGGSVFTPNLCEELKKLGRGG